MGSSSKQSIDYSCNLYQPEDKKDQLRIVLAPAGYRHKGLEMTGYKSSIHGWATAEETEYRVCIVFI